MGTFSHVNLPRCSSVCHSNVASGRFRHRCTRVAAIATSTTPTVISIRISSSIHRQAEPPAVAIIPPGRGLEVAHPPVRLRQSLGLGPHVHGPQPLSSRTSGADPVVQLEVELPHPLRLAPAALAAAASGTARGDFGGVALAAPLADRGFVHGERVRELHVRHVRVPPRELSDLQALAVREAAASALGPHYPLNADVAAACAVPRLDQGQRARRREGGRLHAGAPQQEQPEREAQGPADHLGGWCASCPGAARPAPDPCALVAAAQFCIREGAPAFREAIRDEEQEIAAYLRECGARAAVRASADVACVGVGCRVFGPAGPRPPQQQQPPQGDANSWQAPQGDNAPTYNNSNGAYNQGGQPERQHSNVGGSWGQPQASNTSRPAPYQDNPTGGYNGASGGGYNGPSGGSNSGYGGGNSGYGGGNSGYNGGNSSYGGGSNSYSGGNSYGQNAGNTGGYGYNQNGPQGGYGQNAAPQQQQQQASGFNSWSSSSSSGLASKNTGAGVWSSSGYQKKDPAMDNEPRYNPATRRDNRPTVLVGHSLNFPKPSGGFGSSNTGATSGLGGFNSGTYNPNAVRGASTGNAYNPNAPPGNSYNPNSMGGSARGGFGGNSSGAPSYVDNTNRMLSGSTHRIGSMGLPVNGQPLSDAPSTALGKKAEVLMKMGTAALEKWDRRNMDKSMASSLADHDELRAGPQVIDHGYYQPNAQGAGGGDTSRYDRCSPPLPNCSHMSEFLYRDYGRTMIDNLCAPAGLSRAPPADGLKRFVDLAQTLDAQTIGDILLDKLENDTWQVRLKGLHVVLALLDSPGAAPYQEFFEENVEVVEELRKDTKPSVVSKALQVLRALGYESDEAPSQASSRRAGASRAQRGSPAKSRGQQPQQEVDLLGFGSLSLESSAGPAQPPVQPTADLLGSPVRSQPPPAPAPQQEISLLDGFDTLGSSTSSNPSYAAQQQVAPPQQFYQQPEQDERNKALSHFGKDLFAIANSPRSAAGTAPPSGPDGARLSGGQSAFNFM
ncbi:unnamed protein product [Phytophthora fragariaefolia]|uniref:Unnamed protein product n=1 Tax=Phytophthora fragariaefolia TaxID=1490495 RepID=A0A9W6X0T8_9STRA|nr:unnamed protein product [Phytophthora fragariaefolia]